MTARVQTIFVVLWSLLVCPAGMFAQEWRWRTESITAESAKEPSLVVDGDDSLHLSYQADDGKISYAYRGAKQSKWYTMAIGASMGYSDVYTHIALDQKGNPHICYTPGIFQHAYWDGKDWHTERISPQTGSIEFSCSIVIGSSGTIYVAWYQHGYPDGSTHLRYAYLKEGAWHSLTVDFAPQTGKWNDLVLDAKETPYLSYDCFVNGEIKFGSWNGKSWVSKVLDSRAMASSSSSYDKGMGNSLALSRDGSTAISYYDSNALRVAWLRDGHWTLQTVDEVNPAGGWASFRSSIVLDLQGLPHVSYEDRGTVKHAYWDGTRWRIQVLTSGGEEMYRYNTMTIGKDGTLYVVYRDPTDQTLKLATGTATAPTQQSALPAEPKKN
jgi:hypothetical protein